jgi:2-hydroxychromene-2-carboxylate isomerase
MVRRLTPTPKPVGSPPVAARAIFYFDFQSPYAYLAAARIEGLIPEAEWRPIAFPILLDRLGRLESAMGRDTTPIVAEVSERAAGRGLPPFNPPQAWPLQTWSLAPLRAALFAADRGRLPEFSRVAFHNLFAEGRSLSELDNVVAAAREVGLDEDEVEEAIHRPEIKQQLKDHTEEAFARGVTGIPTVAVGDDLFWGDDPLEEAAAAASRH